MSSHALSDDQVGQELKKMTAFIRQEAIEKAREIEIQANEDFAKEKSKLVREEQATIDAQYEKKFKSASMSQQITRSTVANKTRLRVLQARQELLDEIFETASSKLKDATEDAKKYQDLVKNLILEGAYALNEPKISVRVRKVDVEVAQKAIPDVEKEYKEGVNKDLKVEIDEKNPVEEESTGGVYILNGNGKIEINNTLEERLRLLKETALPAVRETLFGKNENRKFYD